MTLQEIINATNTDAALTALLHDAIKTIKWDSPIVKPSKAVKNELTSTTHGVILRGTRIVIPAALQQRAIDIAHETHLGIEKTKSLIREKIWFPQIDNRVKNTIAKCTICTSCRRGESSRTITYDRNARVTMENCPHRFLWSTTIV